MSKIETVYDPEEIKRIAQNDLVFASQLSPGADMSNYDSSQDNWVIAEISDAHYEGNITEIRSFTSVCIDRYKNQGDRIVGLVNGILDDGSFCVTILGNGQIKRDSANRKFIAMRYSVRNVYELRHIGVTQDYRTIVDEQTIQFGDYDVWRYKYNSLSAQYTTEDGTSNVGWQDSGDFQQQWHSSSDYEDKFIRLFGKLNNQSIGLYDDIQLTNNPNTSLKIGDMFAQYHFYSTGTEYLSNGYKNVGGDIYSFLASRASSFDTFATSLVWFNSPQFPTIVGQPQYDDIGTYCANWIPFNIILTHNESEAVDYINTGRLPSDAFIYEYDVDNIPTNTSGEDPGEDPGYDAKDDTPGEDGTPVDNCQPMETEEPEYSPQSLTNNNLYWLSAAQLRDFIDWFWTDATDIASLGDLWDKITGLYENLAESVLQIRYMPIDIDWVGGTDNVTQIIVGMIEKTHAVSAIVKDVAPIRQIGEIVVPTMYNGSWVNYTPYSSMSLYLPFHGVVELDNDFVMGKKLCVEAVYDILAGTIQYFIHRDNYNGSLVYSTVAKMAVDIPITLQTKTQRDSAIYGNVANLTAGLIGAGASAVAGSPVGMTMGLANLASYQPMSSGMRIVGSISESGAFYSPKKCALYIKRPAYNRPANYKARVGYPANTTKTLRQCSGFTTCYNPRITFAGNKHTEGNDTVYMKPTKNEVDMIYEYLEKGVIL